VRAGLVETGAVGHAAEPPSWSWSFTSRSAGRLFEAGFAPGDVCSAAHGSALAAIAYLEGLSDHELRREELDDFDPCYEVIVTV
jgi:hypothetical protein